MTSPQYPYGGPQWAPAPPPPRRSIAKYLPFMIMPVLMLVAVGVSVWMSMEESKPLHPDCAAALRCCLTTVHAKPPVEAAALTRCAELAAADEAKCAALHESSRQEAEHAGHKCDVMAMELYRRYSWSEQASTVPEAPSQSTPPKLLYPRVSCKEAAERLNQAVESGNSGPALVVRPRQLMTLARTLSDPHAHIYCDGYPFPLVKPVMGQAGGPIVEGPGPHAVLLRPQPSGRFQLMQYCLGCNSVGREKRRR